MNEILTVALFLPLLFILWLANLADRRRPAGAGPYGAGPAEAPAATAGPATAGSATPGSATPGSGGETAWGSAETAHPGADVGPRVSTGWSGPGPAEPAPPAAGTSWGAGEHAAVGQAAGGQAAGGQAAGSEGGTAFAAIAYTLLVLIYLGLLGIGLIVELIGAMVRGANSAALAAAWSQAGLDGPGLVRSFAGIQPGLGLSIWAPALLGIVLLLRPVRRLIARIIPIDPARTVHAVALSFTMLIIINLLTTAVAMPQLTAALEQQAAQGGQAVSVASLWVQDLLLLLLGIVGVGWLARRGLPAALERLGIRVPTWRQVGLGVGAGLGMIVIAVGIQFLAGAANIGENANVQKLTEILIGPLTQSLFGVITLGVAAALGEETIFRGALQPRFGLVFTAILFALTHNQYGFSIATVMVLILAFVLGVIRDRANTTTSMIVHATFNCVQGLLAFLSIMK